MAGPVAGRVIAKGTSLSEEVIDVITYWFGANYWMRTRVRQNFQ